MPEAPPPPLEIDLEGWGSATIIAFAGELDMAVADRAADALRQALSDGPGAVLVDLRGLRFMDSTAFYCLLDATRLAEEAGRQLVVLNGSGPAHRVLELISGDHQVLAMIDDPGHLDGAQHRVAG